MLNYRNSRFFRPPQVETLPIRVAGVVRESIVDGPEVRYVVFVQGCPHHCPGCHNPETHDPEGGTLTSTSIIWKNSFRARKGNTAAFSSFPKPCSAWTATRPT